MTVVYPTNLLTQGVHLTAELLQFSKLCSGRSPITISDTLERFWLDEKLHLFKREPFQNRAKHHSQSMITVALMAADCNHHAIIVRPSGISRVATQKLLWLGIDDLERGLVCI